VSSGSRKRATKIELSSPKRISHSSVKGIVDGSRLPAISSGRLSSNSAPETSKAISQPRPCIVIKSGCADVILPSTTNSESLPCELPDTRTSWEDCITWLQNFKNCTRDERTFISAVAAFDLRTAADLAATLHWKCQRPLQALLAASNARGRNYSARSAKRKRP